MELLTCDDLAIGYDQKIVVDNLSFKVDEGDYLCIVGENGAGKSTLVKTLLRLQEPIRGSLKVSNDLKANEVGYLPQQTIVQRDFPATVEEIVLSGCQGRTGLRPFYNRQEKNLAEKNMEKMRIRDLAKRSYRDLSGGQQQRVLLARALCATQKLLILDEPVSGLDPKVTHDMYELIKDLNRDGITIIMISHDINAAVRYASHILHVGKKWFYGETKDYIKSDLGRLFLDQDGGEA